MYRNISVLAFVNVIILMINLYLLNPYQDFREELKLNRVQTVDDMHREVNLLTGIHRARENLVNHDNPMDKDMFLDKPSETMRGLSQYSVDLKELPKKPENWLYNTVLYGDDTLPKAEKTRWDEHRQSGYKVPNIDKTTLANCQAILSGDMTEINRSREIVNQREFTKVPIYEETYLDWTKDCDAFKKGRGYITVPLTKEEEDYPIAFSIAMYTDVEQMERLLRAVYQPQNLYCIHVDTKSSLLIHRTVHAIVNCFDNVFITSRLEKVKWGDVSVLLPHLNCMRDLVQYYRGRWKYFIDLAGQEFPLRTNYELVQVLKIFNGSNEITASHK